MYFKRLKYLFIPVLFLACMLKCIEVALVGFDVLTYI